MGHATRKGLPGNKLAKKVHLGLCGLRNGVGAAGRLALEGKLCNKNKKPDGRPHSLIKEQYYGV